MTKEQELKIAAAKLAQMTGAIHPGQENIVAILAKLPLPKDRDNAEKPVSRSHAAARA